MALPGHPLCAGTLPKIHLHQEKLIKRDTHRLFRSGMIGNQSWHAAAYYLAHCDAMTRCHIEQDVTVCRSNRPYKTQRISLVVILAHIALKETVKLVENERVNIIIIKMMAQEERVLAQVTVGRGVIIHGIHDIVGRHLEFLKETIDQLARCHILESIAQEQAAQSGTAALVTQDKTKRTHVFNHVLTVIETRV